MFERKITKVSDSAAANSASSELLAMRVSSEETSCSYQILITIVFHKLVRTIKTHGDLSLLTGILLVSVKLPDKSSATSVII